MIRILNNRIVRWMYPYLATLIRLPSTKDRKPYVFDIKRLNENFSIDHDADYLVQHQFISVLAAMSGVYIALVLDAVLGAGILTPDVSAQGDVRWFPYLYRNLSIVPWVVMTSAYYIRIRLHVDIRKDRVPVTVHPAKLEDCRQSIWFLQSFCLVIFCPLFVVFAHAFPLAVVRYLEAERDFRIVAAATGVVVIAQAVLSYMTVSHLLSMEKAYLYFEEFKEQLLEMIRERDARTDKYIKHKLGQK